MGSFKMNMFGWRRNVYWKKNCIWQVCIIIFSHWFMFNQVLIHPCLNKAIFAKTCINVHKWRKNHQILQEKSTFTCGIISQGQWKVWRVKGKCWTLMMEKAKLWISQCSHHPAYQKLWSENSCRCWWCWYMFHIIDIGRYVS